MAIDQQLLEVLACIQCHKTLVVVEGGRGLLCENCQLKFPVRDDVPVLLFEEAIDMKGGTAIKGRDGSSDDAPFAVRETRDAHRETSVPPRAAAKFRVTAGPKKGMQFALDRGTCKAMGRAVSDPHKTNSFHVDVALALDENTRRLIQQYVAKQFRRKEATAPGTDFGFRRTSDIVLEDVAVSRLHAMIFFDDIGVGVLDLVSKNGTFVNGDEVESRLLRAGDVIELGESKIVLEG